MRYAPHRHQSGAKIACPHATKNQNLSEYSKRKIQSKHVQHAQTRIQAGNRSVPSRQTAQKRERPALVPGHALGVLYSGLHGTVWPNRTSANYRCCPAARTHANRPTAYSREARQVAKGITGQIGTFGDFTIKTGPKSVGRALQRRNRKMIQSKTEARR